MTDIHVKSTHYTEAFPIKPLTINPLSVASVQKIAPIGVHVKELNQIAPISVESLRVDHVRHIDPLRIDKLNITQLPPVNVSIDEMPPLDLNVRRLPPIAIALRQDLDLTSCYTMRARVLGLEIMRMQIEGQTKVSPRDRVRREQSRSHDKSFAEVAAAGNPAIPLRPVDRCACPEHRCTCAVPPRGTGLSAGVPVFSYSLRRSEARVVPERGSADSAVNFGG